MAVRILRAVERDFINRQRVGRLATADAAGRPHVMPVCYAVDGQSLYITVDQKPKRAPGRVLQRVQNILVNPAAAVVVDHYDDDWTRLAWVMLRGDAEILESGEEHGRAQRALTRRYPQYRSMNLAPLPVIALRITTVNSWGKLSGMP